jgi:hypothetical protein
MVLYMFSIIVLYFNNIVQTIRNSSFVNIASLILVVPILMLNFDNNDRIGYEFIFNSNVPNRTDPGFMFIIQLLKFFGIENFQFVMILLGLLIIVTFLRFSVKIKNMNFIILLYFVFPFIMDIIQIRNTFMAMIFINALLFYSENKKIVAIILAIIAASFHILAVVFIVLFIFLELYTKKNEKSKNNNSTKRSLFSTNTIIHKTIIFGGLINIFFSRFIQVLLIDFFPNARVQSKLSSARYFAENYNLDSILFWGGLLIFDLVIFSFLLKKYESKIFEGKDFKIISVLHFVMFSSILLIGSMSYLYHFNRAFRIIFVVKYLLFGILEKYLNDRDKFYFKIWLFFTALFFGIVHFVGGIDYDNIIRSNYLLDFLK